MQRIVVLVLMSVLVCGVVWGQSGGRAPQQTDVGAEMKSYTVRVTEFRLAAKEGEELIEAEILRAFDEARSAGTLDVVNTFNLTIAEGGQASLNHGGDVPVVIGEGTAEGSLRATINYRSIGTRVELSFDPRGAGLLRIEYESSSIEHESQVEDSPMFHRFRIATLVEVEPGVPVLLGSGTPHGGRHVVVTVEE